jgi:hypothetical protein
MVAAVGASVSFKEGEALLSELADVRISARQVERIAERIGEEVRVDERADTEGIAAQHVDGIAYAGMDGTGTPVRKEETEGRTGKQEDGSAKTREVKLIAVWTANRIDDDGRPTRDDGSITYSAAIETAANGSNLKELSPFASRADRESQRRRFQQAKVRVVMGDGAPWIWGMADELFYGATQIVDIFHAREHLFGLGKALFGASSEEAVAWSSARKEELEAGRFDELLAAVKERAATNDEARKALDYFTINRARMDYPEFRRRGLMIGSGNVEAGCKTVVGVRLKRAGMHWSVQGANAIIALRCSRLSGRFDDFWERRNEAAA